MQTVHQKQKYKLATQSSVFDTAPTLSALASKYSLYMYDGEYNCNSGTTYSYRYIQVVDSKRTGLTQFATCDLGPNISTTTTVILKDLLDYNFSYATSKFLGSLPGGGVLDWALGNTITVLNSLNQNAGVTVYQSKNLYQAEVGTVTMMVYYYVYDGAWKLIGNSASVGVSRYDHFAGYINGRFVSESGELQYWNSSTKNGPYSQYIETYDVAGKYVSGYLESYPLGSFEVEGMSKTYTFTPIFYAMPGEIF